MTEDMVQAQGDTLEDALEVAAQQLGVARSAVEFKYDREHLAAGASTVRIFAKVKSAETIAREAEEAERRAREPAREERSRDDRPRREGRDRDSRGPRRDGGPGGRDGRRDGRDGPPRNGQRFGERREPRKDPERDEQLREKARGLAKLVLAGEGPQSIPDLNSYERHLVHTVVAEAGGLASRSEGEELRKTVHIERAEG